MYIYNRYTCNFDEELNPQIFIEVNIIEFPTFQELKVLNTVKSEVSQYKFMNKASTFLHRYNFHQNIFQYIT